MFNVCVDRNTLERILIERYAGFLEPKAWCQSTVKRATGVPKLDDLKIIVDVSVNQLEDLYHGVSRSILQDNHTSEAERICLVMIKHDTGSRAKLKKDLPQLGGP